MTLDAAKPRYRSWINGNLVESSANVAVASPLSGDPVASTDLATAAQVEAAVVAAAAAFGQTKKLSRGARSRLLAAIAAGIAERRQAFVDLIVVEAGKPRQLADGEVGRAITTFTIAADEVKRLNGEVVPMDLDAVGRTYRDGQYRFVPTGPVLAITPFNFPLNLVAHKVAPALAVGAPVILKPAPQTPGAANLLAEVFAAAAKAVSTPAEPIPLAFLQVVHAANETLQPLMEDSRVPVLSFTGSDHVGWALRRQAFKKKVFLELGGNAAVIVCEDADLARAAKRVAFGAFAYAGQVCISVQRVLVAKSVHDKFVSLLLEETKKVRVGDPSSADVLVGPLINEPAMTRIRSWLDKAVAGGAKVLCGGDQDGRFLSPTVVSHVSPAMELVKDEVFGPVVVVEPFAAAADAFATANASRFGLQAGVFTHDTRTIQKAYDELEVGGVIINDVPTFRADHMPYGGIKDSGMGREGLTYAMREYCEIKLLVEWQG